MFLSCLFDLWGHLYSILFGFWKFKTSLKYLLKVLRLNFIRGKLSSLSWFIILCEGR